MKRFLTLVALSALLLPAVNMLQAADVSLDYFYDNLNGGNWYEVADYGYVWQPDVATNPTWRPYTDGYWAYTDVGWTWVSYEDFGWATYHYGRWARLSDYGWVWVPGYDWGPAWVSWRTGGDYVGWAPLPPPAQTSGEVVYESHPVDYRVDSELDIGPAYYNFIDLRYIGEPVLRDRIFDFNQNVVYMDQTVNVTNIAYNNGLFYDYGPDFATVSAYSVRPIQRLTIERANVDPTQAIKMGNVTKVEGDRLILGAPTKLTRSSRQIAPPKVKARIDQPKLERGWSAVTDATTKARLQQKFKTENPKNIPKPNLPAKASSSAAGNVNAPNPAPASATSPNAAPSREKGKRKGQNIQRQTAPSAIPGSSAAASPTPVQGSKAKKGRDQRPENRPSAPESSPAAGAGSAVGERGKKQKTSDFREQQTVPSRSGSGGANSSSETTNRVTSKKGKHEAETRERVNTGEERVRSGQGPNRENRERARETAPVTPVVPAAAAEHRKMNGQAVRVQSLNQPPAAVKNRGEIQASPEGQVRPQEPAVQGKAKKNKNRVSPNPQ